MKPYEDDAMRYDEEDHRYILKKDYVLNKTGIDLTKVLNPGFSDQPQELANQMLDQVSEEIYNFIYSHNADNEIQEYYLDHNEKLRQILRDSMLEQVKYVLRSGDMFMYCGVNLKSGQVIEGQKILQNAVAPLSKMKLERIIPDIGVSILYQGKFFYPIYKGEEE